MSTFDGDYGIAQGISYELKISMLQIVEPQDLLVHGGQGGHFQ